MAKGAGKGLSGKLSCSSSWHPEVWAPSPWEKQPQAVTDLDIGDEPLSPPTMGHT